MSKFDLIQSVLPHNQIDNLENTLSAGDIETLSHLVKQGMGANTIRALTSDLNYLQNWCIAATGQELPWPASESLILKFIAHHLYDAAQQEIDASHGMPRYVSERLKAAGLFKSTGAHAPATVKRRLASWATITRWKDATGAFASPKVRNALRLAVRACDRPRQRKSNKAITGAVLEQLLATCGQSLADKRDRAILLVAFASGGRRRSEIAGLRITQLKEENAVPINPRDMACELTPCLSIRLGRTKTTAANDDNYVVIIGRPVIALQDWLQAANISSGAVFRKIDRWGNIENIALTAQSVNNIIKARAKKAGLNPLDFTAHGLRSGYLTEAANKGVPLPQAMQQSGHKSLQQAAQYYNDSERKLGQAARIIM